MSISIPDTRPFYNGEHHDSLDGKTFTTSNPATEDIIASVSESGNNDINAAVIAAKTAFGEWTIIDAFERGKAIIAIADAIEEHAEELAWLDVIDSGKTILDAREDTHAAQKMFRYFGGLVDKIEGATIPAANEKLVYTVHEPYGVIAAITAWNYPLFNASAKIAPVIATGNACILKPAEETPLTALKLAEIIANVDGIPKGLVSVVNGAGERTGALLISNPGVNRVTFTGSTETGKAILKNISGGDLKGAILELGGKAPVIVMADANLEGAAKAIAFSAFFNQGQTCTAATRILVEESVHDVLLEKICSIAEAIVVGDPSSEDTIVGPLISKIQYEKVVGYIERAVGAGQKPLIGGYRPSELEKGYYLTPTIFDNVSSDNELFLDEVFGPVLTVSTFSSVDDAITLANKSNYGLAAGVWTKDLATMHKIANALEDGIIWGNTLFSEFPGAPAGGSKNSGYGREYGKEAINEYTQIKTVWISLDDNYSDWF